MALTFAFDPNSPEDIERQRQMALQLLGQGDKVQSVGEGIGRLASSFAGGLMNRQATQAGSAGRKSAMQRFSEALGFGAPSGNVMGPESGSPYSGGSSDPSSFLKSVTKNQPTAASANPTMDPLQRSNTFAPKTSTEISGIPGIIAAELQRAGYAPHQVAGALGNFQQESAFKPTVVGDHTIPGGSFGLGQWNRERKAGLENFARQQGGNAADPNIQAKYIVHELGTSEGKAGRALKNARNVEEATAAMIGYERPQGWTPNNPMGGHGWQNRLKYAQSFMGADAPSQMAVGSPARTATASIPLSGGQGQPNVQPASYRSPVQSQALPDNSAKIQAWMGVLQDPFSSPQQQQMAMQQIQALQTPPDPMDAIKREAAQIELDRLRDPNSAPLTEAQRLELEQKRIELEGLKNPKPKYNFITGRDGSIFRADENAGNIETVYGAKPEPGFRMVSPEQAKSMGLDPSKPYQVSGDGKVMPIGGEGTNVTVNNTSDKAESEFEKKTAEGQAKMFTDLASTGMTAKSDLGLVEGLRELTASQGGLQTGIKSIAASYGIPIGEDTSDLQAANAIINKLVPAQRAPGSGPMSDRDVELYKASLPSLWNQPGGNALILDSMEALTKYNIQQGDIASRALTGEITRGEATKQLRELKNPLEGFAKRKQDILKAGKQDGVQATPKAQPDDVTIYKESLSKPVPDAAKAKGWGPEFHFLSPDEQKGILGQ